MKFSTFIKRNLNEADWILIIANLLPVYGVLFKGWNAKEIFLVYCLETVIIGFFTMIKLGIATMFRKNDWWYIQGTKKLVHGSMFILFFLLHYGLFVVVQMTLFLNFTSINNHVNTSVFQFIFQPFRFLGTESWLMLSVFLFGYGYENMSRFILDNEYLTTSFMRIMLEPYMRIFVQQFSVLLGGFILGFGGGKIFIILFAFVKIFFTVFIYYDLVLNAPATKSIPEQK
ncbi:MAG: DUF6498-containing protein [Flavisolibacter sp.]